MLPLALSTLLAASPAHPELGRVKWLRDFEAALAQARSTHKPLLVLFDEVPGCETVRGFGSEVLSDAAMALRIERDFVPVAIFNNGDGKDREVLRAFAEPAWNNPVVRIIDANQRPLAPRFAGPYDLASFTRTLEAARPGPAPALERLTVSAPCFWECEAQLGRIEAVRSSRVGYLAGEEVVEVEFDTQQSSREALIREANRMGCATHVFSRTDAEQATAKTVVGARAVRSNEALRPSAEDTKYYLLRNGHGSAGLSALEATRANAALRFGGDPEAAVAACRQVH